MYGDVRTWLPSGFWWWVCGGALLACADHGLDSNAASPNAPISSGPTSTPTLPSSPPATADDATTDSAAATPPGSAGPTETTPPPSTPPLTASPPSPLPSSDPTAAGGSPTFTSSEGGAPSVDSSSGTGASSNQGGGTGTEPTETETGDTGGESAPDGEPTECVASTPPSEFQQTLDLTWQEMMGEFEGMTGARPVGAGMHQFTNTILDQVMAAGGSLRYCVRWDNPRAASAELRDDIAEALSRHVNRWFEALVGYDCWPYEHIPVTVTAWAVRPEHRDNLQWSDGEGSVRIDVGHIREEAPECLQACNRFFNRQAGFNYPDCPGGFEEHFDLSLWLTEDFGPAAGVGGDWGQRMSPPMFIDNMHGDHPGVWLHEFGHGFGLPDYYNWQTWVGDVPTPPSVMVAGQRYSEWDDWMLRRTWSEIRQFRYLELSETL